MVRRLRWGARLCASRVGAATACHGSGPFGGAQADGSAPGSGSDDDEHLWQDDWLLVFSKLTTGDEHIVIATGQDRGSLWKVQWEFDLPVPLDLDLAGLLDAAVQRFLSLEAVWDPSIRQLVWDCEVADNLGPFP